MTQSPWSSKLDELVTRVRAGENTAIVEIDTQLERPGQPTRTRAVLRSLRSFCLMQSGRLAESALEAAALLTFAQRHDHQDIVAQCYRVLAAQRDVEGDQSGRHDAQRLAVAAAERSGDSLLLGRVEMEYALILGEAGQYECAAEILERHVEPIDWEDANHAVFGLTLSANLGWVLNLCGRCEEALAATLVPPAHALVGMFGAALRAERWRARHQLGEPVDVGSLEALLAESLENDWSMVVANLHVLLSRQYPASSIAARTHAALALNVQGLQRSYLIESCLSRAAECARASGDVSRAVSLEQEAGVIRDAKFPISALGRE